MKESEFESLKNRVIKRLKTHLSEHLHYHCPEHTERVLIAAEYIAIQEKITRKDLLRLKVAALFHDIGFLKTYENHEAEGIIIAHEELRKLKFNDKDIEIISGMIRATKIPQIVNTHCEAVMADADLEYLGTQDFEEISHNLYLELKHRNPELTIDEWNRIQIKFLDNHQYFTAYAKNYLEPIKQKHLQNLKDNTSL
jgi:uncharacterized protein